MTSLSSTDTDNVFFVEIDEEDVAAHKADFPNGPPHPSEIFSDWDEIARDDELVRAAKIDDLVPPSSITRIMSSIETNASNNSTPVLEQNDDLPATRELKSYQQWVAWRYLIRDNGSKPTKPPVNPHTGFGASHSNPDHWASYKKAKWRAMTSNLPGVGFVLAESDPFTGIDLDKCRDADTGKIEPWAQEVLDLAETYAEISPSGTGIRMIGRGKIAKAIKSDVARVEIYGSHRYLTITEDHIEGTPTDIRPAPKTLEALIARVEAISPKRQETESTPSTHVDRPPANLDDDRVRAWRDATVGGILSDFAKIVEGGRNNHLNDVAAYRLGRLAASGYITKAEAWNGAKEACQRNGLWKDDGAGQCRRSFENGFAAGLLDPHKGPEDRDDFEIVDGSAYLAKLLEGGERERVFADGDEIDPETGEVLREAPRTSDASHDGAPRAEEDHRQKDGAQNGVEVEIVVASSFAGKPVPPQEWLIQDLIPKNNVTLLMGDGGTGKSLLGLQLGVAAATGGSWIEFRPKAGKVLFVSAEDEIEELHRRLACMCPRLEMLDNLAIVPLAGKDAVLAAPEGRSDLLKETRLFKAIRHIIAKHRPDLLILDTLADLFGGDHIKTTQARQFIGMLRGLALEYHVTVLLLAHPSQNGLNSGSGTGGSQAWNNSVRSRLYLERRIVKDGLRAVEDDVNIRVLKTMKSNRAAIGGQIVVRYDRGVFVREQESAVNARDAANHAEHVFLELLAKFTTQGRNLSPTPCAPTYAPTVFAKDDECNGFTKRDFEKAMSRLFTASRIVVEESGPPSKRRQFIVLAQPHGAEEPAMSGEDDDEIVADAAVYSPDDQPEPPE